MVKVHCKCGAEFRVSHEELHTAGYALPEVHSALIDPVVSVEVCRVCYVDRFMAALDTALEGCDKLRKEIRKRDRYPV
jgi:hypothetical protein